MRVFLTGNRELAWRWEMADFLTRQRVDVIDPEDDFFALSSIFHQFKVVEDCDLLIAYFAGLQRQHLKAMLEISYALKLAKDVIVVGDVLQDSGSRHPILYSKSFPDLHALKEYLSQMFMFSTRRPRLVG